MQLNRFDLNLLLALDALLREKNVTRAAERLYVSQPSMSGALQRLRDYFGDQLLVRIGRDMELTPKAQSLVDIVREILLLTQTALKRDPEFNPAQAKRRFRLIMSDYCNLVFLPRVISQLAQEAPDVQCHIEPLSANAIERLNSGDVDLLVLPDDIRLMGLQDVAGTLRRAPLFKDRWTCAVAADHPTVGDQLTREQYFDLPHVLPHFGGATVTPEQIMLHELRANIRVEATAPGFVTMLFLLPGTPLIATIQERLARILSPSLPVRTIPPPVNLPELQEVMIWHERNEFEPGHVWLRQLLAGVSDSLA